MSEEVSKAAEDAVRFGVGVVQINAETIGRVPLEDFLHLPEDEEHSEQPQPNNGAQS